MRPLPSLRNLFVVFILFVAFCAPGSSGTTGVCSSRVGPWSDCKTRCLPQEQLYAQCSSKLGVLFSTRSGLAEVQTYGWTFDPIGQCGVPSARIWKLKQIAANKAVTGRLSLPDVATPDCTRAYLDDLATETDRIYYIGEDVTAAEAAYLDSMSTPITPASPTQIVQTFNAPADGDIANAASVNTGFQALENSVEALRYLTYGGGFYVRAIGVSNTVLTIQPLGAVIVKQLGVWTAVPHTVATTIDPLALAGGAFAVGTRYYVYVNVVAGVINWSVSTTAPDTGLRYKSGDEQYQFISTFVTAPGAAVLIPYSQNGSTYVYGTSGLPLLNAGNALVSTNVPFSYLIPSTARTAKLFVKSNGTNLGYAGVISTPTIGGTILTLIDNGASSHFEMSLSQGASLNYFVSNAAMTLTVDAFGFNY